MLLSLLVVEYPTIIYYRNQNMLTHSPLDEELLEACQSTNSNFIDIERVKSLLAAGANANSRYPCKLFPIAYSIGSCAFPLLHIIAGKENSVQVAQVLIEHGAKIDETDTGIKNTPLLTAIALGDKKLAEFFISEAIYQPGMSYTLSRADSGSECQNTPLVLALKKDMDDIALMLIHAGADITVECRQGQTALHWACMLRKTDIIAAMLERNNIDPQLCNDYGYTPYDYYIYDIKLIDIISPGNSYAQANMLEFSDLYHYVKDASELALQDRIRKRNQIPVDEIIAKKIIRIEPAEISLEQRHQIIVSEQFERFAKFYNQFASSFMPFIDSHAGRQGEVLRSIVYECVEESEKEFYKDAPLSLAVKNRDKEKIQRYLKEPSLINKPDPNGFTALHWASMYRDNALIKQLMECGADQTMKTNNGRNAIDYYVHQITATDFKDFVSHKLYGILCYLHGKGANEMPEFNDIYASENQKILGVSRRNRKIPDLNIFGFETEKEKMVTTLNASEPCHLTLFFKGNGRTYHEFIFSENDTLSSPQSRKKIMEKIGIPSLSAFENIRFLHNCRRLNVEQTFKEQKVENNSTLHMFLGVRGD